MHEIKARPCMEAISDLRGKATHLVQTQSFAGDCSCKEFSLDTKRRQLWTFMWSIGQTFEEAEFRVKPSPRLSLGGVRWRHCALCANCVGFLQPPPAGHSRLCIYFAEKEGHNNDHEVTFHPLSLETPLASLVLAYMFPSGAVKRFSGPLTGALLGEKYFAHPKFLETQLGAHAPTPCSWTNDFGAKLAAAPEASRGFIAIPD